MNDMGMIKKRRYVTVRVLWNDGDASESVVSLLLKNGARGVEIDRDVDVEDQPSPGIMREDTVFRIRLGGGYQVWQLLTDIATHPGVFSAGEI